MSGKRIKCNIVVRCIDKIGFTNMLAIYLVTMLIIGLAGGFILALLSIKYQYTGALACWTVVFTPIGTAASIVLGKIVDKNKEENTGSDGEGVVYAAAKANNFVKNTEQKYDSNDPQI